MDSVWGELYYKLLEAVGAFSDREAMRLEVVFIT
jgi:hypothetical protein